MNYLYHRVPEDLQGNILYPMNTLKDKNVELYNKKATKYEGREHIMGQMIPVLDCLWNDVLHFSAVDPADIKKAILYAGREAKEMSFYKVDPHLLDVPNTIVYLYEHKDRDDKMDERNFTAFDPDDIARYSALPQMTQDYYKEVSALGKSPLLYHGVPHILYKGTLDVSLLEVVTV